MFLGPAIETRSYGVEIRTFNQSAIGATWSNWLYEINYQSYSAVTQRSKTETVSADTTHLWDLRVTENSPSRYGDVVVAYICLYQEEIWYVSPPVNKT